MYEERARYAGVQTRRLVVEGNGPTAVLLHGFGDSADTWRGVLRSWERHGRAAVAVDLPGFGAADRRRHGPQLPQHDDFVSAVVAEQVAPIVVGNSLGATLSARAGTRRELGIAAVMPIAVAALGFTPLVRVGLAGGRRAVPLLARLPPSTARRERTLRPAIARILYADPRVADPEVLARFLGVGADPRAAARLVRDGYRIVREITDCVRPADVACPMTVVHGTRDRLIPVSAARRFHELAPGSRLVLLPRVGHCPQLEVPDRVTSLMVELADDIGVRAG